MVNPEISVIVANYNHSQFIEESVRSLFVQTFDNIQIIIVDDGSTDNSREKIINLAKEDSRVRPIFLEKNHGKWFALNYAIEQASGNLITLNDADDASCKDRLKRQYQVLKDFKSVHNLCGFSHCYSQNDMELSLALNAEKSYIGYSVMDHEEVTKKVYQGFKTPGINHYYVGNDYEVHGASSLFYKQLWEHGMKFLPGNMGLRCQKAEDSDHNTKLTLLLQKTSVLKEPLYCYRRNTSTNNAYLENK
jgi:glycosyltransferase involved in cell wall biosynthesis